MKLTTEERRMAAGERGEAVALAMAVMTALGERYDAPDMVPIKGAHVDGCIYRGDEEASLVFAEHLAARGARVAVPTTLSAGGARPRALARDAPAGGVRGRLPAHGAGLPVDGHRAGVDLRALPVRGGAAGG